MYTGCSLQALPSSLTLRITLKRVITASCLSALTMTANYTILTLQVATKLGNFCGPAWNINKIIILKRYNVRFGTLKTSWFTHCTHRLAQFTTHWGPWRDHHTHSTWATRYLLNFILHCCKPGPAPYSLIITTLKTHHSSPCLFIRP